MSEQEKKSSGAGSSVVLVEQSAAGRHKQPFRPIDMQEEAPLEAHHKRSKAPAVPSVAEELKDRSVNIENKDRKECEHAMSSEKHKHRVSKILSTIKRRGSSPETITLAPLELDTKRGSVTPPQQPIPTAVSSSGTGQVLEKYGTEKEDEDDSITEELPELRTEVAKKSEEWSDEEEAGGLPRCESRASRVSRAVRQLFCCGVRLDAPSEHQLSARGNADGI